MWLFLLLLGFLTLATVLPLRLLDRPARGEGREQGNERPQAAPRADQGELQGTQLASLLPLPPGGLKTFVGRPAFGQRMPVQAINGNAGFWVGSSERDRVYVEWGGGVRPDQRSRFQPRQGERVDLIGPVRPAPADPAQSLRLNAPEARQVRSQGAYVDAAQVRRSSR